MMINLIDPKTDQVKQTKVGFSWTTFFFGFWPALFRGDWMWFVVMLILELVFGIPTVGFGAGIVGIVFSFIYNKLYINELLGKGWIAADDHTKKVLITKGFIGPEEQK